MRIALLSCCTALVVILAVACGSRSDVPGTSPGTALGSAISAPSPTVISAHPVGDPSALTACNGKMEGERLIGAFESTAGAIADWIANAAYPDAPQLRQSEWRSLPPTSTAYLCYFSGAFFLPGGPPGPVGSGPQPTEPLADRALIFIDASGKQIPPSKYGPSAIIPIVRPGGRW
jgi:hypothetical protein